MADQAPSSNQSFLLDLPPEIRRIIYKHLFTGSTVRFTGQSRKPSLALQSQHHVFWVCRQIYRESHSLYYFSTVFVAADYNGPDDGLLWLREDKHYFRYFLRQRQAREQLSLIKHIRIDYVEVMAELFGFDLPALESVVVYSSKGACLVRWKQEQELEKLDDQELYQEIDFNITLLFSGKTGRFLWRDETHANASRRVYNSLLARKGVSFVLELKVHFWNTQHSNSSSVMCIQFDPKNQTIIRNFVAP